MEIDLKADISYLIIKVGNGYVTIDPHIKDTNIHKSKAELLNYIDTMEGNGRIIEKLKE